MLVGKLMLNFRETLFQEPEIEALFFKFLGNLPGNVYISFFSIGFCQQKLSSQPNPSLENGQSTSRLD